MAHPIRGVPLSLPLAAAKGQVSGMEEQNTYPLGTHRRFAVLPLGFSLRNGDLWMIVYQRRQRCFPCFWRHEWVNADEPLTCRTRDEAMRAAQDVAQSPAVRGMLGLSDRDGDRLPPDGE